MELVGKAFLIGKSVSLWALSMGIIELSQAAQAGQPSDTSASQVSNASSTASPSTSSTSSTPTLDLSGFLDIHYSSMDLADGQSVKELDARRYGVLISKTYNDKLQFVSELGLKQGAVGENEPGQIQLEQAYVQLKLKHDENLKLGMFLLPVGIINESHLPHQYNGTKRNPIESNILPTTWYESGVQYSTVSGDFSFDLAGHTGLKMNGAIIREGRQQSSQAEANDLGYTARIQFNGWDGFVWSATVQYQEDITQSGTGIDGTLIETHAVYKSGPFSFKTLFAQWEFGDQLATLIEGASKQVGYYFEPSFRINDDWSIFVRMNTWDVQAGSSLGTAAGSENTQFDMGVSRYLAETVTLKADYQLTRLDGIDVAEGFNLGIGVSF